MESMVKYINASKYIATCNSLSLFCFPVCMYVIAATALHVHLLYKVNLQNPMELEDDPQVLGAVQNKNIAVAICPAAGRGLK